MNYFYSTICLLYFLHEKGSECKGNYISTHLNVLQNARDLFLGRIKLIPEIFVHTH